MILKYFGFVTLLFAGVAALAQQTPASKSIFEVPQADIYARYRYIDNTSGVVTSDDLQYRLRLVRTQVRELKPAAASPRVGATPGSASRRLNGC